MCTFGKRFTCRIHVSSNCWPLLKSGKPWKAHSEILRPPKKHGLFFWIVILRSYQKLTLETENEWIIAEYFGWFSFFPIPSRIYSFYFCVRGCNPRRDQTLRPSRRHRWFSPGKWWCALGSWILTSIASKQNRWKVRRSTSSKCSKNKQWAGEAQFFRHLGIAGVMSSRK